MSLRGQERALSVDEIDFARGHLRSWASHATVPGISIVCGSRMSRLLVTLLLCAAGCGGGTTGGGGAGSGAGGSGAQGGTSSTGGGGSTTTEPGCAINSDCAQPLVCAFNRCHDACETTRDCPPRLGCVFVKDIDTGTVLGKVCQLPDEVPCRLNTDCRGAQICAVDGRCRNQCGVAQDCVRNQVCADGACADPSEVPLVDGGR